MTQFKLAGFRFNKLQWIAEKATQKMVLYLRQEKGGKAWAYEFARPLPDDGQHPDITNRLKGAFHSSDLWYVFKSLKHCWRPRTQGDWALSEKMLTAWINFAKYSDPNGEGEGLCWEPCTKEKPQFMLFRLDDKDAEASIMGEPIAPDALK